MGIDSRQAAYQQLIELAEKQGYVTFDNIIARLLEMFLLLLMTSTMTLRRVIMTVYMTEL